ncbi:digestive organ expansion factor homolog [Copidosoma floridanum]|uniref:digestive organ expansion factor homolog n=1 Tax=Copidosoma floridanum TaxID=29053 RepID=UPI000C6FC0E8|nr:digestive organ expansion factor homolog [Copidosoma floridanum]
MPKRKKFSQKESIIKKTKRKEKFNYRTSSYIKEREARVEEIENLRQRFEEKKAKQQHYNKESSDEEEEDDNPLNHLLKTFGDKIAKAPLAIDSESSDNDSENENGDNEEEEISEEDASSKEEDLEDIEDDDIEEDLESADDDEFDDEGSEEVDSLNEQQNKSSEDDTKKSKKVKNSNDEAKEKVKLLMAEKDEEDEETAQEDAGVINDPFTVHLKNDFDSDMYTALTNLPASLKTEQLSWPTLGNVICEIPTVDKKIDEPVDTKPKALLLDNVTYAEHGKVPQLIKHVDWDELHVKSMIQKNISKANYGNIKDYLDVDSSPLTPFQRELFSIINNYQDLLYTQRSFDNESQIRLVYCLHTINHVLKTRTKVLHHNAKIQKSKLQSLSDIPDEYRDQGLTRPKVLILVPFRHSCFKVVELLISIFIGEDRGGSVINKKRFMEDFGSGNEIIMPKRNPKPEDYEMTFKGNTDDTFKIGISITKKALKLYSEFYSSDIIISSVLGLRMLIGAEGEEERDFDFLASIELLILDQTEIFYMQNWDHLLHVFDHLHLQLKKSRGTDFSRVRSWIVNGWSKYYRQTLIFSQIQLPEILGIFNKRCFNYAGKLKVVNPLPGTISQVMVQIPQVFNRFNAKDHLTAIEARFDFFTKKILPQYRDSIMNHTLIFVPSYLDYVKLRNYFRKEEMSFVQICEYTKEAKIARARDMFFHSDVHFLLYTERFHFYRRIRVKGIRHIIFYAPPAFAHLYSEMCNLMQEGYQNPKSGSSSNMTVTMIYCKYDMLPLASIVGTERAGQMIMSDKHVHMIMTGA